MSFRKKIVAVLFSSFSFFVFFTMKVFATTQANWPTSPLTRISLGSGSEFHEFIAYLYGWGIGLGAILTFAMFIIGGIEYMVSSGNEKRTKIAINRITSAVLGLVFLLASWLILNTINPQITRLSPLPPLWDEAMFSDIEMLDETAFDGPPCAFAILYSEEKYAGGADRVTTGRVDGLPYESGIGFAQMLEEEKELLEKRGPSALGNRHIIDNTYIETPGACVVSVYYRTGLFIRNYKQMGVIPLPNEYFSDALWEEEKASHFELRSATGATK
jgi:hypothetical protein